MNKIEPTSAVCEAQINSQRLCST